MLAHRYLNTFKHLLVTDLKIFSSQIKDKIINSMIWVTTMVCVFSYLMPAFGLESSYSSFIVAGSAATAAFFEVYPSVVNWVSDITGEQVISYYLTLPIPAWLIFVKSIISSAINAASISIVVLPLSKILLWDKLDLSMMSYPKYFLIFVVMNLFFGAFTLWTASRIPHFGVLGNAWMRLVFPIWFLGCYQFTWEVLFKTNKTLGYLALLNPMVYVMEGIRGALLGQEGYISFWICIPMIMLFTVLCAFFGIRKMKQRLDYV